jgi:hypothetical protein
MKRRGLAIGVLAIGLMMFVGTAARADAEYDKALPQVSKQMAGAKLTLEQGITAASKEGKPISAQYEIDEDTHKFQLSVFVSSGPDLLEVLVDFNTGAIKESGNVTGDDIKDAKKQKAAMDKATKSLAEATAAVAKANEGYSVAQVVPALAGGKAVATFKLVKGAEVKTVKQDL